MLPDDFEGLEESRKIWCRERIIRAREWVGANGRDTLEVQLEAALERMVGLESLLNEKQAVKPDIACNLDSKEAYEKWGFTPYSGTLWSLKETTWSAWQAAISWYRSTIN